MVQAKPEVKQGTPIEIQYSKTDQLRPKQKAQAREGNLALDVLRPLFEEGQLWDF